MPLDPLAPAARVRGILRDCGIQHLVCSPETLARLQQPAETGAAPFEIPLRAVLGAAPPAGGRPGSATSYLGWDEIRAAKSDRAPADNPAAGDIAYIMYTSGSTGEPKGIVHTHGSGLSYARLAARTYGLSEADRLGNHAPLHFDQSTMEYFAGPLAGATTVIIPEIYLKMPASLSQLIEQERLSIWYSVPFTLIQLLLRGALESRDLSSLRWVLFGGESLPRKFLNGLMAALPDARFSNVYG
ncbi:MAG: AMP-binding protein, partial [Gammaproteobacteria bacterium]|nr:AMP-binding protein [Gammaproteobacteria bacterium]